MARALHRLTNTGIQSAKLKPGRHGDGGGLYLNVTPGGAKSWLFMWTRDGKRREMGLGAYPAVSLAKARRIAETNRAAVADGRDPIAERAKDLEPTFGECADKFLEAMEGSWRNEKHRAQWRMTLERYCAPIRPKRVSEIGTDEVLSVLTPIWSEKPETASRLRGRIERVLDFAKARGWRDGENPALWRGHLRNVLPARQKLTHGHHAAMPYQQVPEFCRALKESQATSARALEFLILTAARAGEVRGATWEEVDIDQGLWVVPAGRMKAGKEHRVPLCSAAVDILREMSWLRSSGYVFPGQKPKRPLSMMAMDMLLRRMKVDFTVHGFRSSFRDWAGEETSFPREVAEQALAHTIGSATERAYRRGDALEKRRQLMEAWAHFLRSSHSRGVVLLHGRPG